MPGTTCPVSKFSVVKPTYSDSVDVHQPPVTGASVMPSTTAGEVLQYPDSDEPTFPAHTVEEEGEVSDQETGCLTQESDQQISEEHSYRETVRVVRSFME